MSSRKPTGKLVYDPWAGICLPSDLSFKTLPYWSRTDAHALIQSALALRNI